MSAMAVDTAAASTSAGGAQNTTTTNGGSGEERQIAVRLTTKDSAYSIPATKFLVPSSWRRFHLSELINKVLENDSPIPFDFLVTSSLLRSSLGAYCAQTGTSEEVTLEIEYLPSTLPPQLESTLPSEDWVSDVSLGLKGSILTSSYAGTLSLSLSSSALPASNLTFSGHDLSALSACHVPRPTGSQDGKYWVASGGMDRVGRVWEYELPSESLSTTPAPAPAPTTLYALHLHTAPISSVRSRPLTSSSSAPPHLLTAGWDGIVGVWDLSKGVNEGEMPDAATDGERSKKKRRKQPQSSIISKTPVGVLRGHTGKVSRAIFDRVEPMRAYTAGFADHSVRSWDLETGGEVESKTSDKALLCLTQLASRNLLATGSTDRLVSLWDLRTATSSSSTASSAANISLTLPGHTAPVSAIAAHPTNAVMLASGSYDSTVRIWDARSTKAALFVLPLPPKEGSSEKTGAGAGTEKVLAVGWDGERLVAGGEGARVVVWRVSGGKDGAAEVVVE